MFGIVQFLAEPDTPSAPRSVYGVVLGNVLTVMVSRGSLTSHHDIAVY